MEFTLTHNNPKDTQLVGPGVSYTVRSSDGCMKSRTTIARSDGATVAEIEWHAFRSRVRMGGTEMLVNDLLKRTGWQGLRRKFDVGGHTYKWETSGRLMTLRRDESASVAEIERRTFHDSKLRVSPDAADILDYVVLTLIIVWTLKNNATAAAAEGAAAGASAVG